MDSFGQAPVAKTEVLELAAHNFSFEGWIAILSLVVALAAILGSVAVAFMRERGAAKRFNAETKWRLADDFRREIAALTSVSSEQASQMLTIQKYGATILSNDANKFDEKMARIDELSLDTVRISQSINVLVDPANVEDEELLQEIMRFVKLLDRTVDMEFPQNPVFSNLASKEEIGSAAGAVVSKARVVLRRLQETV